MVWQKQKSPGGGTTIVLSALSAPVYDKALIVFDSAVHNLAELNCCGASGVTRNPAFLSFEGFFLIGISAGAGFQFFEVKNPQAPHSFIVLTWGS